MKMVIQQLHIKLCLSVLGDKADNGEIKFLSKYSSGDTGEIRVTTWVKLFIC